MTGLNDIIRTYGDQYRQTYGQAILPGHQRALRDLSRCRTAAMGGHCYECPDCGTSDYKYHSCRNRHCPQCQGLSGEQ